MGQTLYWANLTLAFVLELCALAALGFWGFSIGGGPVAKTVLAIGIPLCAAVLWGLFAAPRAPVSVPPVRFGTKVLVFGSATLALYATGYRILAVVFALLVIANAVLIRLGR